MNFRLMGILSILFLLIVSFQNCGKKYLQLENLNNEDGELVIVSDEAGVVKDLTSDSPQAQTKIDSNLQASSDPEANYFCLLEGANRPRVGFLRLGSLEPQVVCMSQDACLNKISQVYNVVGADRRVSCQQNQSFTVKFSDKQIENFLNGI